MKANTANNVPQNPPGQMYDLGEYYLHVRMNLPAKVQLDLPTVVIEAGCGWHSSMYAWLQSSLSRKFKVISYDRAGLGWSRQSSQKRDATSVAGNLHSLLNRMGVKGKVVLIGHSIAGLYLRLYASQYRKDIVGLVLLDASHPKQNDVLPTSGFSWQARIHNKMMESYTKHGLHRLKRPTWELRRNYLDTLPLESITELKYLFDFPTTYITPLLEWDSFETSAEQVLTSPDLDNLPLLVISAGGADNLQVASSVISKHTKVWSKLQKDLLNISSNSRQLIIEVAGHCTLVTERHHSYRISKAIVTFIAESMRRF